MAIIAELEREQTMPSSSEREMWNSMASEAHEEKMWNSMASGAHEEKMWDSMASGAHEEKMWNSMASGAHQEHVAEGELWKTMASGAHEAMKESADNVGESSTTPTTAEPRHPLDTVNSIDDLERYIEDRRTAFDLAEEEEEERAAQLAALQQERSNAEAKVAAEASSPPVMRSYKRKAKKSQKTLESEKNRVILKRLFDQLDDGDDDALIQISEIMSSRKDVITKEDWERLNIENRLKHFFTKKGVEDSKEDQGLAADMKRRWDLARCHFFRSTATPEILQRVENEMLLAPGAAPRLRGKIPPRERGLQSQGGVRRHTKIAHLGLEGLPPSYTPIPSGEPMRERCRLWSQQLSARSVSCEWPLVANRVWTHKDADMYMTTCRTVPDPEDKGPLSDLTSSQVLLRKANRRRVWRPPAIGATPTKCAQAAVIPCRKARPPGNPEHTLEYLHSRDLKHAEGRIVVQKAVTLSDTEERVRQLTSMASPHPEDVRTGRVWVEPVAAELKEQMADEGHMRGHQTQDNLRYSMEISLQRTRQDLQSRVQANREAFSAELETRKLMGHVVNGTSFLKEKYAARYLQGPAPLLPMIDNMKTIAQCMP